MSFRPAFFRACGVAAAAVLLMAADPAPVKVGVLGNVQGTATATGADNTARTLKAGDDIFQGDVIRTDENSNAQVLFLDRSALTLTPGSEVKMDSFVYNPGSTQGQLSIEEAKGAFRFIGGALSKQDHVEIVTPVSTIGIRGGIEQTHITPAGDNAEAIFVYGHDMTVKDKSGRQIVLNKFGVGAKVFRGGSGPMRMTAKEVSHRFQHFNRINSAPGRRMQRMKARGGHGKELGKGHGHEGRRDLGKERGEHRKEMSKGREERREERNEQREHRQEKGGMPWQKEGAQHGHGGKEEGGMPWNKTGERATGERGHKFGDGSFLKKLGEKSKERRKDHQRNNS